MSAASSPLALIGLALALSIGMVYGWRFANAAQASRARSIIKTLPLAILSLTALLMGAQWLLTLALALSALGDWLLAYERPREFLFGLVSFALAHIAYAVLFAQNWQALNIPIIVIIAAYSLLLLRLVWHGAGEMRGAVAVYSFLISLMTIAAFSSSYGALLCVGVLLFVGSDSLIALQKFAPDRITLIAPLVNHLIWFGYLFGQSAIFWAVLEVSAY